jgi:hypothetical protein
MKANPLNKQSRSILRPSHLTKHLCDIDKIKKEDKFRMKYKNNSPSNS